MIGTGGAAVHVPVPAGSSFVMISGSVGPDRGAMALEWEPPINDGGERINTTSWWRVPATLYMSRLDPHVVYNLSLRMDGAVGLASVSFYSAWSMPSVPM